MTIITGLTAARMLEIEAASVVSGEIAVDDLILTRHDGTTINAGDVRGPKGDTAVGPNAFINGSLAVNQRSFTTINTDGQYGFDRWALRKFGNTCVGTENKNPPVGFPEIFPAVFRIASSMFGPSNESQYTVFSQRLESVRTFASKTVTVSFWAANHASSPIATPSIAVSAVQNFGTGGSDPVKTHLGKVVISTTPLRYSVTAAIPSIQGKTIGTSKDDYLEIKFFTDAGANLDPETSGLGMQFCTIETTGYQIEEGSVATGFDFRSYAEELRNCQRYYYRRYLQGSALNFSPTAAGDIFSQLIPHPVPMLKPGSAISNFSNVSYSLAQGISWDGISFDAGRLLYASTQATQNSYVTFGAGSYVGVDAEL